MKLHRKIEHNEKVCRAQVRFLRPRSRSQLAILIRLHENLNNNEVICHIIKIKVLYPRSHRKVKQNDNLCPVQDSGSLAVFKVTSRDQGHYKRPSGAFVTYCNISCC